MKLLRLALVGFASVLFGVGGGMADVLAKGPVDKIAISGDRLAHEIAVTEGEELLLLSPWSYEFLGTYLPGVEPGPSETFEVSFYLFEEGRERPIYTLQYHKKAMEGHDVIELPAVGTPGYVMNNGTIMWGSGYFYATDTWSRFMEVQTQEVTPPATGDAGLLPSTGGGGCYEPLTDGASVEVEIVMGCFGPTVARVGVGETVTWVNRDAALHNVYATGQTWSGGAPFSQGQSVSATFGRAGVFPYVCTLHPGMVGVVVVGDGASSAAGYVPQGPGLVPGDPARAVGDAPMSPPRASGEDIGGSESLVGPWLAAGAAAIVGVAGVGLVMARRR